MRLLVALAIVSSGACSLSAQKPGVAQTADLIVHHGVVYTVADAAPRAAAVAIAGDRVIYVGTDAEALSRRGPKTRVIDAGGRAVLPGLHDAHGHVHGLGEQLQELDLRGTTSLAEVTTKLAAHARTMPQDAWIIGRGWDQNDWPVKAWPSRTALDAAAAGRRVWLTRIDGHAGVASSRALQEAGLSASSVDPAGGRIIRDGSGAPDGVLVDRAMEAVTRLIPPPSDADIEATLLRADAELQRLGLTTVHDAGIDERVAAAYRRLVDSGRLRTRVYAMLRLPLPGLRPFLAAGPVIDLKERLSIRAIKIVADGALGSRGAALLEPYADEPGTSGFLTTSEADIYALTRPRPTPASRPASTPSAIAPTASCWTLSRASSARCRRPAPCATATSTRRSSTRPRFRASRRSASSPRCSRRTRRRTCRGCRRASATRGPPRAPTSGRSCVTPARGWPADRTSRRAAEPAAGFYAAITRQAPDGTPAGAGRRISA
jgi:predicted amidohydrolase YtcJ